MCGVFAMIPSNTNGFTQKEQQMFNDLLYVTALRGTDGTGIMYGTNRGDFQMHKQQGPSLFFMGSKEYEESRRELFSCGSWVVGHCRAATRGERKDANSHPFVIDNKIALVQNGTYYGSHKHIKDVEVDTEAVGHLIADNLDKPDAEVLKQINAAYALMWYDFEKKQLKIVRNSQRPLYYSRTKSGTTIISSEWGFIQMVVDRVGFDFDEEPFSIKEYNLGVFTFQNHRKPTEKWEEVDGAYKAPTFQSSRSAFYNYGMGGYSEEDVIPVEIKKPKLLPQFTSKFKTMCEAAWGLSRELRTHMNIPDYQDFLARVQQAKRSKESFFVEAIDYRPVVAEPNNNQYYIYGTIYDTDKLLDGKSICWVVEVDRNKVDEIINYATSWYEVTLDQALYSKPPGVDDDNALVLVRADNVHPHAQGERIVQ